MAPCLRKLSPLGFFSSPLFALARSFLVQLDPSSPLISPRLDRSSNSSLPAASILENKARQVFSVRITLYLVCSADCFDFPPGMGWLAWRPRGIFGMRRTSLNDIVPSQIPGVGHIGTHSSDLPETRVRVRSERSPGGSRLREGPVVFLFCDRGQFSQSSIPERFRS